MKIDDIPLPPSMPGKCVRSDQNNNSKTTNNHNNPLKRSVNTKLPVGLLRKESYSKFNDSVTTKKELFLPSVTDRIQLPSSATKGPERRSATSYVEKTQVDRNKSRKETDDVKNLSKTRDHNEVNEMKKRKEREDIRIHSQYTSKRKHSDYGDNEYIGIHRRSNCEVGERIYTESRIKRRTCEYREDYGVKRWRGNERGRREDEDRGFRVRSQVVVCDRRDKSSRVRHNLVDRSTHAREYRHGECRTRRERPYERYGDRHNGQSARLSDYSRPVLSTNRRNHADSLTRSSSSVSASRRSSFVSSTSHSSSPRGAASSISSPESPSDHSNDIDTRLFTLKTSVTANLCLRTLNDTLIKINTACKTSLSRRPASPSVQQLSAIPLPREERPPDAPGTPYPPCAPAEPPEPTPTISNGHKEERVSTADRKSSNSVNTNKSRSRSTSLASKMCCKSPPCSLNESFCGGESEVSDTRTSRHSTRPAAPRISTTATLELGGLDRAVLGGRGLDPAARERLRCDCVVPDPDQWGLEGRRACGSSHHCVLRRLRVECSRPLCPTGDVCHNRQFQDRDGGGGGGGGGSGDAWRSRLEVFWSPAGAWRIRALSALHRRRLLFEVGGRVLPAESEGSCEAAAEALCVSRRARLLLDAETHAPLSLVRRGGSQEANARVEKWLVNGVVRLGVFASREIAPLAELVLLHSASCMETAPARQSWAESDGAVVSALRWLVLEAESCEEAAAVAEELWADVQGAAAAATLERCRALGALSLLRVLRPPGAEVALECLDLLLPPEAAPPAPTATPAEALYTLECRLPPYWHSTTSPLQRVFFYHGVTGQTQWDMPVYPWEGHGEVPRASDRDEHIYDYNGASLWPVTREEAALMCERYNERYRQRERRAQAHKSRAEACRRELFRMRIGALIAGLLAPYRAEGCARGRIASEGDLRYLANKLTQTILLKELKLLDNASERLTVTAVVETKTRTYVRTYMQSRGATYFRPPHKAADRRPPRPAAPP